MKYAMVVLVAFALGAVGSAQNYTESIVYSFGTEFDFSFGPHGLVQDASGNFYGNTLSGGQKADGAGCGFVFKVTPSGTEAVLYTFGCSTDGSSPNAGLTIDKSGNLYGTTELGGLGYGVVFEITAAGKYSVLHKFGKTSGDGKTPLGPLTLDASGNLYGVTQQGGGACDCGTIFRVTSKGVESILYKFTGGSDGGYPVANLLRDAQGNLYGTTNGIPSGSPSYYSVLFKLSPKGLLTTLYNFTSDGNVVSYIARNSAGNFYGGFCTTSSTAFSCYDETASGLWELTAQGLRTYYTFTDPTEEGSNPSGPLLFSGGNLYGTNYSGGQYGMGTVWKFAPSTGIVTVLYTEGANVEGTDGQSFSGVIIDASGNLWGTSSGGNYDDGAVFELTP